MQLIRNICMAVGFSLALSACSSNTDKLADTTLSVDEEGYTAINQGPLNQELQETDIGELSVDETDGLLFMREEEKLAHDVYTYLFGIWEQKIFDKISDSEQSHTDAVKVLLDRYSLADPVEGKVMGELANPDLQNSYDTLASEGEASLIDALMVGAAIEEIDMIDIAAQKEKIEDNDDIVLVYDSLMKGSRNHLRAFVKNLKNNGVIYEPRYLSREEYDSIINTDIEKGFP